MREKKLQRDLVGQMFCLSSRYFLSVHRSEGSGESIMPNFETQAGTGYLGFLNDKFWHPHVWAENLPLMYGVVNTELKRDNIC